MKLLTVIGARPQFVKAAVISREIALFNAQTALKKIKEVILHTGQHYDHNMSDIFFEEMHIPEADYNLGISHCSHGAMTGRMLEQIEAVLLREGPDVVLVFGDTNSTLAGALAAAKLHIPVAHVEAGLRSFNMNMPEEINRKMTDTVSSYLFCPTATAMDNLAREGIGENPKILPRKPLLMNVGDVMYDAAIHYREIAEPTQSVEEVITALGGNYYLATLHREENTGDRDRLRNITEALDAIACTTRVVLPLHPRTRKAMAEFGLGFKKVISIDPVGYFDMLVLIDSCKAVFTDSGGLQKEAYYFKKPCVTLRDQTEWVELVDNGSNILAGADRIAIQEAEKKIPAMKMDEGSSLYGQGNAGALIVETLIQAG